jgi:PAS domain S-box-containing protein
MIISNQNSYQSLAIPLEDKALLFQAALDQSYNSVVITDANCEDGPRIVYANPSFEKMTGYSMVELIGKSPKILQGPLTDSKVIEEMRVCIRSGQYFEGSTINYDKNKNPYNVEWSISPIKDDTGVVQYFVSVQKNITTFIKAQQERNLLVRALNDSPDCVMITDVNNKIVFVNTGFEQLTGYKEDEVLGCEPSILWKNLASALVDKPEARNANKILHFQTQAPNLHKDGSLFYVDQSIAHIQNETGTITHHVSFSKDSTERLQRELTLKDLASKDALTDLLTEDLVSSYSNNMMMNYLLKSHFV